MKKIILTACFAGIAVIAAGCAGDVNPDYAHVQSGATVVKDTNEPADVVVISDEGPMQDVQTVDAIAVDTPIVVDTTVTEERFTYIVAISDLHVTTTDGKAAMNLRQIGESIAGLPYEIKGVFAGGDIVFNLPYDTIEQYHNDTADRFDITEEIFNNFTAPVYPAIGNHDQDIGRLPQQMTEQLFMEHFGVEPYYAVDLGTWKFIVMNNFKGPTQDPESPDYDLQAGSFGQVQLDWLEDQLADGRPAILMTHFPLFIDVDISEILEKHKDTVRLFLTGHTHGWVNMSNNFVVPSMIIGSSQYDADSYMILELDNVLKTWRMLDWNRYHWGTAFAVPRVEE
jgi:predicted MPP superfamily phosphohydrolase